MLFSLLPAVTLILLSFSAGLNSYMGCIYEKSIGSDTHNVSFSLADGMAYRTKGASKAVPGFDVIDYGQEDYVFGDSDTDARHWSEWVLKALQENQEALEELFN